MTSAARRGLRRATAIGAAAVALTVAVVILTSSWAPSPQLTAGPSATPMPTPQVACAEEPGPLAPGLAGPACPAAILAVELAVAPVRLPIERIDIQPGPFFCDLIWPGIQTVRLCRGYAVLPGQFMHGWASFVGSPKLAVVMLGLDLQEEIGVPGQTRPPWRTTLVTVEIPPDGWVMP